MAVKGNNFFLLNCDVIIYTMCNLKILFSRSTLVEPTQSNLSQPQVESSCGTSSLLNLDNYRPFFRELDLGVFKILSVDKVGIFQTAIP